MHALPAAAAAVAVAAAALLAAAAAAPALAPAALHAPWSPAYGHGVGYELLDPVHIDGVGLASLEVLSTPGASPSAPAREIRLALLDAASGVTVRDVTFEIVASKAGAELFGGTFRSGDGTLLLILDGSGDPDSVELVDEGGAGGGFLEALVGIDENAVRARGGPVAGGGLYLLDVAVATAGSFDRRINPPARFAAGLSIPETSVHAIDDADYGRQEISVITYYDTIGEFEYDRVRRSISFAMPFNWDLRNINETSVVHEELSFDRRFGDLMASRYEASVNGIKVPDRAVTIDDLTLDGGRIVHMVLGQSDLYYLRAKQAHGAPGGGGGAGGTGVMKFVLEAGERAPLGAMVDNGQFRVSVGWEPWEIRSGEEVVFGFNITDVFLRDRPVAAEYDVSLVHEDGGVIASASGVTDALSGVGAEFAASIPDGMRGIAVLRFENLGGAAQAKTEIPVVVDRAGGGGAEGGGASAIEATAGAVKIPGWIKDGARWWADGLVSDREFASSIQYMIAEGIISVPAGRGGGAGNGGDGGSGQSIPHWIKDGARWWADGLVSDREFASSIQYMVANGIVRV